MNSEGYKDPTAGINRNILECKAVKLMLLQPRLSVLIETYWNVKRDIVDAMQKTRQY